MVLSIYIPKKQNDDLPTNHSSIYIQHPKKTRYRPSNKPLITAVMAFPPDENVIKYVYIYIYTHDDIYIYTYIAPVQDRNVETHKNCDKVFVRCGISLGYYIHNYMISHDFNTCI